MSKPAFPGIEPIRYQPDAPANALAFRYYDKDKKVRGKRMEDHLRMAVCYWHTFVWNGFDVFGAGTFGRPWHREGATPSSWPRRRRRRRSSCSASWACRSSASTTATWRRRASRWPRPTTSSTRSPTSLEAEMKQTGVKLLWGTANLFSHPRFMGGAATNPDPEVFTFAAAQVKKALEVTQRLGGANYVLWGGREGYETLLNTDMKRELDQLGRFMNLVVEHKHKIGFKGPLLIEPKPREPTKHQYDYDTATVHAFFQKYGLKPEDFQVNIEANHATLAGHSFEHEVAYALVGRHLRQHRHEPRRSAARAGTPTSSATTSPSCRWSSRASSRRAASRPAASTSTPRSAARATTRPTCSTATSAAWTTWRARC